MAFWWDWKDSQQTFISWFLEFRVINPSSMCCLADMYEMIERSKDRIWYDWEESIPFRDFILAELFLHSALFGILRSGTLIPFLPKGFTRYNGTQPKIKRIRKGPSLGRTKRRLKQIYQKIPLWCYPKGLWISSKDQRIDAPHDYRSVFLYKKSLGCALLLPPWNKNRIPY